MTTPAPSAAPVPPERAERIRHAALLLHAALDLSTHQLASCYTPADEATQRMVGEHRSLLALTQWVAGDAGKERS